MTDQLSLAFSATTAQRFEEFHQANPEVYATLARLAREWVGEHGARKCGIRMLWEVARWELIRSTRNADYKLNDHYTGYYARLLMHNDPELRGVFDVRVSEADEWIQRQGRAS